MNIFDSMPFVDYIKSNKPELYSELYHQIKKICHYNTKKPTTIDNNLELVMSNFMYVSKFYRHDRLEHKKTDNPKHLVVSDTTLGDICKTYKNGKKTGNLWREYRKALGKLLFTRPFFGSQTTASVSAYEMTDTFYNLMDDYSAYYLDNLTIHILPVLTNELKFDDLIITKLTGINLTDVNDILKMQNLLTLAEKQDWQQKANDFMNKLEEEHELKLDIPVDIQAMLDSAMNKPGSIQLTTDERLLMFELIMYTMINMYKYDDTKFTLPHTFITKSFGRFYAQGRSNLQGASKIVRHICLSNFTDIDIECAGITIMTDLVKQHYPEFTTENIDYYISNKSQVRYDLAKYVYEVVEKKQFTELTIQEQEFHIKRMKTAITSMTFGSKDGDGIWYTWNNKERIIHTSALIELFNDNSTLKDKSKFSTGRCYVASLKKHPFFRNFRFELLLMFKLCGQLLAHQLNKQGKLELYPNCIFEKTKRVNRSQLTAYYNQTTERKILDEIIDFSGTNLLLPCHDGACLYNKPTELELTDLIKQIKLNVGITISFSIDTYVDGQLIDNSDL